MWYIPILAILADQTTKHQDPLAELTRVVTFLQVRRQDLNWCESTEATMEGIEHDKNHYKTIYGHHGIPGSHIVDIHTWPWYTI